MKEQYSIFRRFSTLEQAEEVKSLLDENNIPSEIGDNVPPVDVTFSGNTLMNKVEIRLRPLDFDKANKILEKNAENIIEELDQDYYLFEFKDDELYEILLKPDEWNEFDYILSQKLLTKRGKSIDQDLLKTLKNERIKQLAKPEENQKPWIITGYFFAVLGGFIGLIIGYFLWTAKKTLPDGQKVYAYSEKDRKHGKYIFYIGLIIFPSALILRAFTGL